MKKAIAITHVCFEDAGTLEDALSARGVALRTLQAGVDDLSQAKDADILVVLGGPIGVYELDRYPFLRSEFAVIETMPSNGLSAAIAAPAPIASRAMAAPNMTFCMTTPPNSGRRLESGRMLPNRFARFHQRLGLRKQNSAEIRSGQGSHRPPQWPNRLAEA